MSDNLVYRFWLCEANDGSSAAVYLFNDDNFWIAIAPQLTEARSGSAALAVAYAVDEWIKHDRRPHSSTKPESWLPSELQVATPEETIRFDADSLITRLLSNVVHSYGYRIKFG